MDCTAFASKERWKTIGEPMALGREWVFRDDTIEVTDPEDGSVLATVPMASARDASHAVEIAHGMRSVARAMPTHEREAILTRAAQLISEDAEGFAQTIAREGIKTIREARSEVGRCIMTFRLAAAECSRGTGETVAFDQRPGSEKRFGYYTREPAGVVVAITPFNDPLNLVAHKVAPALASGNAIIVKPHRRTPLSALRLAHVLDEAGLPRGILQVVTGLGQTIGDVLVSDDRVRMVSFTGGVTVGKRIASMAGIKKLAMELGSNCPTIVMPDADLDRAVKACASGAFAAAGQNCLHVQRIYLHRNSYAQFRDRLVELAQGVRAGPKLDEATDIGCLIDEDAARRVEHAVQSALQAGGRLLTGGRRHGTLFAPTLIDGLGDDSDLMTREIYGPVTVLSVFDELDEVLRRANASDYGLQAAIFTNDLETAFEAYRRLDAGAIIINDSTDYRMDAMPFGGVKSTGIGREGVRYAMAEMTEPKLACFTFR